MAKNKHKNCYHLFFLLFVLTLSLATPPPDRATTVRAGYYLASSTRFCPLASLDATLYTDLYYSSLAIDAARRTLALPTEAEQVHLLATFSKTVKAKNSAVRTLLSVATDSGASNAAFAAMAADSAERAAFLGAAVALARAHGFDGIDVAWRFPASAVEMASFGFLVAEWRAGVPPGFLLTATVYFSNHVFDASFSGVDYPSEAVARSLDWVNVMAFGFRRSANANATAFDAPLYDRASHFSASYGVVSWLDAGVPASKVVMGIPLYGKSWFLKNKANNGLGRPVVALGPKQRESNATGVMAYSEIETLMASGRAETVYDNESVSAYVAADDIWVSFDSVAIVEEKLKFAAGHGLLGYFLWPVSYDDANFTVSRRASDVWLQSSSSSGPKDGTGIRQVQSPVQLPPVLGTPAPMPASTSAATAWLALRTNVHLRLGAGMLLLYYQRVLQV